MRIEVTKDSKINGVNIRQVWEFNLFDLNLVFVGYKFQDKLPKKRKWATLKYWDKYDERSSTLDAPQLEQHIKDEARQQVIDKIKVLTWNEWKN